MNQQIESIIFTTDQKKGDELKSAIIKVLSGIHVIGVYTDMKELKLEFTYAKDAIIFIILPDDCTDIAKFLESLRLKKIKIVCIIPESGEYANVLAAMNIPFTALPVTSDKLQIVVNQHIKDGIIIEEKKLKVVDKSNDKGTKIREEFISLGVSIVLKTDNGSERVYLNNIESMKVDKVLKKVILYCRDGKEKTLKGKIGKLFQEHKCFGLEAINRSELINLRLVEGISIDRTIAYMEKKKYVIHNNQKDSFYDAWHLFWHGKVP
jgi:hypothetical protein